MEVGVQTREVRAKGGRDQSDLEECGQAQWIVNALFAIRRARQLKFGEFSARAAQKFLNPGHGRSTAWDKMAQRCGPKGRDDTLIPCWDEALSQPFRPVVASRRDKAMLQVQARQALE